MAPVVEHAKPLKIGSRVNPGSDCGRIADAGIIYFQPGQVYAILQGELDVAMMQLQRDSKRALGKIVPVQSYRTLGCSLRTSMIGVEVYVVRIAFAGLMVRVVDQVTVGDSLVVSRDV